MTIFKALRLVSLLVLTVYFFFWVEGKLLWLLFLSLFAFFVAVDIFKADVAPAKASRGEGPPVQREYGVVGHYDDDGDSVYGAYILLKGSRVLIDIREDQWVQARVEQARLLISKATELEASLEIFLRDSPEFLDRRVACIGLHSQNLSQGEVFWEPEGYSLLENLRFREK